MQRKVVLAMTSLLRHTIVSSCLALMAAGVLLFGMPSLAQAIEVDCVANPEAAACQPQTYQETCEVIGGITVCNMQYCDEFDCDDFAYAFDEECEELGIPCWQAELWSEDEAGNTTGHVIDIVQTEPPHESVFDYYCAVEPQNNNIYCCWYQDPDDSDPSIPSWCVDEIGYDEVGEIWDDGLAPHAGEECFTENPAICEAYEQATGNDPENYE